MSCQDDGCREMLRRGREVGRRLDGKGEARTNVSQ